MNFSFFKFFIKYFFKKEVITEVFKIVVKCSREFVPFFPLQPGLLCSLFSRYALVTTAILKPAKQLFSKSGIHIPFGPGASP